MSENIKVLFIGDINGPAGTAALMKTLPELKKRYNADITVVNGENSAKGNGISASSAENIFTAGADVITTGNHVFRKSDLRDMLESNEFLLRPANMPSRSYGKGVCRISKGRHNITVINLMGSLYMTGTATSPFEALEDILKVDGDSIVIVDFHGEATSEKRAMALYYDGRISAFFGTHTHVQTADEQILPGGTAYITDAGMVGVIDSVIGAQKQGAIDRFLTGMPSRSEEAVGDCILGGCFTEIDGDTGKALRIERISLTVPMQHTGK